ncbi:MAG: transaldolase family protein [Bryobacteraceae bacterium]|jgi:transaldolase
MFCIVFHYRARQVGWHRLQPVESPPLPLGYRSEVAARRWTDGVLTGYNRIAHVIILTFLEDAMAPTGTLTAYKSHLFQMTQTTPTCLWNDSAALDELAYSIEHGAVGATCNPVIAVSILKKQMPLWRDRIETLIREMSTATEDQIGWKVVEEMSIKGAALLKPIFDAQGGRNGRLSIQTDPRLYRNTREIVDQALRFSQLAPNMIVKIPATRAGIPAMEEATYRGVSINATVSFSLPQAIAVAEAVERGLARREKEGLDIRSMGPVSTIMVGRLDDWLKVLLDKENLCIDPGYLEWAGVAVFKKAYRIYRERGYRLRLLSAAFRNHMHWSEFIGGGVVISPPYAWQVRYNASDVEAVPRMDNPVDPEIVRQLTAKFPDFARANSEVGISIDDFDSFGPTRRTLRQFIAAGAELNALIRDIMIPNPDKN